MDVHKESIDIAVAEEGGEVGHHGQVGGDLDALRRAVRKLESLGRELVFLYEAGPCGYGVYRDLIARGHACWVVAPSNTPRRVRDWIKTDRRDRMKLAGRARADRPSSRIEPVASPLGLACSHDASKGSSPCGLLTTEATSIGWWGTMCSARTVHHNRVPAGDGW